MLAAETAPSMSEVFALGEKLLAMLRQQIQHQHELIALLSKKRESIRKADFTSIGDICRQEQRIAGAVSTLERHRVACTKRITAMIAPGTTEPLKISDIAQSLGGMLGDSLKSTAEELLDLFHKLQHESAVVRRAAESLSGHITGIMQSVASALSTTPVYEARGRIHAGTQMEFSVDVRS